MSRAPRVLFVTHNAPRFAGDAAGSFVLRLAVGLQHYGARVQIIAPGAAGLAPSGEIEGVQVQRVRYASEARMTLAYTGNMAETVMGSWSGRVALGQLLRATRRAVHAAIDSARRDGDPFDVVHVHWWFPSGLALWGARRPGDPPIVITMHGSDVRLAEKKTIVHPVMRSVLGQAGARTAVSSWLKDIAQRIAPEHAIVVAPMPVDTQHFVALPQYEARHGILFVGRLNAQKGLADVLAALALPALAGVTLHVVGDGPDREALEQQAAHQGLGNRIQWYGTLPQPALVPLYAAARAVVMPSRGEGLGLVAVEAQLCGTPVIAYNNGGVVDVVQPDHGGTLVPTGDVQALATAIAQIIASDSTVERLGMLARADMLARFTPQAVAARYLDIYAGAVAQVRER
jgi:glycosyltransferase involved in cell wall biosynthesis